MQTNRLESLVRGKRLNEIKPSLFFMFNLDIKVMLKPLTRDSPRLHLFPDPERYYTVAARCS